MTVGGIDLSATEFWGLPLSERAASFASLRAEPRPRFFVEPETPFTEKGPGYYALVRYADVVEASRHPEVFCSKRGATSIADLTVEFNEYFGSHFCLGSHLARRELTVMLRELLTRVPDISAGEPDRLLSSFVNGIKHLPCQF
jgi:cytochrome P450